MDRFAQLISNVELFIRHILSGVTVTSIYLLSVSNTLEYIDRIEKQPLWATFIAGAIGFAVFAIYRIIFWVVGDGIAWLLKLSAPSVDRGDTLLYHSAYARFLSWRRREDFSESLNGYLYYRWAVVHFAFIAAITLSIAIWKCEINSFMYSWACFTIIIAVILWTIALWQASFLFRVERELYMSSRILARNRLTY